MLLRGLTWLILFQLLGTALNMLVISIIPGPILGFVLLFIFLLIRGETTEDLDAAASSLLKYLPLLLVPPAVGIMAHWDLVKASFLAVVGSLFISIVVTIVFAGWLMQHLMQRQARKENQE